MIHASHVLLDVQPVLMQGCLIVRPVQQDTIWVPIPPRAMPVLAHMANMVRTVYAIHAILGV